MTDQEPDVVNGIPADVFGGAPVPPDDPGRNLVNSPTYGPMPMPATPAAALEAEALTRCQAAEHPARRSLGRPVACQACLQAVLIGPERALRTLLDQLGRADMPDASRDLVRVLAGGGTWALPDLVKWINAGRAQPLTEATVSARVRDARKCGYPILTGKAGDGTVTYRLDLDAAS